MPVQLEQTELIALKAKVIEIFTAQYGKAPSILVAVPSRLNLMGGHTQYYGGYVLTSTVEAYTVIALHPRADGLVQLADTDGNQWKANPAQVQPADSGDKVLNALNGAAWALEDVLTDEFGGWDGLLYRDFPVGLDLGAEAALWLAAVNAHAGAAGVSFDRTELVYRTHKAIKEWRAGRTLYADLLAIVHGQAHTAQLLDLQGTILEVIPLPTSVRLIMLDTGDAFSPRGEHLINERFDECRNAARSYRVNHLRDLSMSRFEKDAEETNGLIFKRARHFLTENGRTILAGAMLRSEALATVGKLMNDSHKSLREEYDIYDDTLDVLLACCREQPNVYGARWSGMGNGVLMMVREFSAETASKLALMCYKKQQGTSGAAWQWQPAGGIAVEYL